MQIPTSALFILFFSLTSVVEAKYHPPSTASPDYQKCKHGVDSDPSCIPIVSDDSVSNIRDSKGRFLLLNEKHPELKSYIKQQTKSPYMTPTATITGDVVIPSTPQAPALVAPELSTGTLAPTAMATRDDNEGDMKFGGASSWGRPFLARSEEPEPGVDTKVMMKRDTNHFSLPSIPFLADGNENGLFDLGLTSSPPAQVDSVINNDNPQAQAQAQPQVDLIGDLKFGYGGGWGRPWKRSPNPNPEPKDCLEETTIFSTATATATATITQVQFQTATITTTSTPTTSTTDVEDNTGNAKWGFGGGWGRPFVRSSSVFTQQISEEPSSDDTGNMKFGYGGGWGRPWKRQGPVDGLTSSSRSMTMTTTMPQEDVGNKKFGYGGGWGRPW
ncbi:hypothetical protein L486_05601 [Kwoniella mangroviensis CBS 10435]|uniref:Uncharacterized protein n=1 Tax=Kwoniella mangroviensis CBS 10435 TaxID=1331196 RepID=A0A1B9IMK1_9TREE|nr:hypothetical protein L486_05601 [Kwoniella mangroviensis CBS 10435]